MSSDQPQNWISSVQRPSDFDVFWQSNLDQTTQIDLDVEMTYLNARSTDQVDVFDVRYTSYGGLRIAAWYCKPKGPGPFPGLIHLPGYVSEPTLPKSIASAGYAVVGVAPRGKLRSNEVFNPGYPGLLTYKINSKDSYGNLGFYMDAVRAFDMLEGFPEVDSSRLGVRGDSQGGALTLLVAALRNEKVHAAAAGAPYLCSMMDAASLTQSYPYQEINDYLRVHPEEREVVRDCLNYFDIHNFADRIRSPIVVNLGLKDDVCPPETGFALFNQIGSDEKYLYTYENCAHDAGQFVGQAKITNDFLAKHLSPEAVQ